MFEVQRSTFKVQRTEQVTRSAVVTRLHVPHFIAVLWLVSAFLYCATDSYAATLLEMGWHRDELVLAFSDSVGHQIDLASGDSSQVVIRISGVDSVAVPLAQLAGPDGRSAILTRGVGDQLRLTVTGTGRLGYTTLWKPFTHRLVLFFPTWDSLGYAEGQFHKGLIALEQNLGDQAEELLSIAHATGDRRAGSVLGSYYASRGHDSLARTFLGNPADAEDFAALAAIQRRTGDTGAASASDQRSRQLQADSAARGDLSSTEGGTGSDVEQESQGQSAGKERLSDTALAGIGLGGLLVVVAIILLVRRADRSPDTGAQEMQARPAIVTSAQTHPPAEVEVVPSRPLETPGVSPAEEAPAPTRVVEPTPSVPASEVPLETTPGPAIPATGLDPVEETRGLLSGSTAPARGTVVEPAGAEAGVATIVDEKDDRSAMVDDNRARAARNVADVDAGNAPKRDVPSGAANDSSVESASEPSTAEPPRRSVQAEELQKKLKAARGASADAGESVVTAARRLGVSRDNIELRRKMESADRPNR